MSNLNLLSSQSRVEVPFIKVTFGDEINGYTFGVFDKKVSSDSAHKKTIQNVKYPNYIKSLSVKKINGQVNQYTLVLNYPITHESDPNFFEKVFSSIGDTRSIIFSYGDLSAPLYIFKNEEALITKITQNFSTASSVITYTVSAVSKCALTLSGAFSFTGGHMRPSEQIKKVIENKTYGLQDIFTGLRNHDAVEKAILSNDQEVEVQTKFNISPLDYIKYLVSCMHPLNEDDKRFGSVYTLVIVDDFTGEYGGTYLKVVQADKNDDSDAPYVIDFGYPSQNIITNFQIQDNETYSIYYKYNKNLTTSEYVKRINEKGELEDVYAPVVSSGTNTFSTNAEDANWWTNVTEYPIKASITLKGLLRPAILMSRVRLNVYYYGRKHTSSGLYIITGQTDTVDESGFKTELTLTRVGGDA